MKVLKLLALLCLALFGFGASANEIFFCKIKDSSKIVQLSDSDDLITYTFGSFGETPELVFSNSVFNTGYFVWDGIGTKKDYSVTLSKGNYKYQVFASTDTATKTTRTGLNIGKLGNHLGELLCDPSSVRGSVESIALYLSKIQNIP